MRVYKNHAGDDAKLLIKFHWPNAIVQSAGPLTGERGGGGGGTGAFCPGPQPERGPIKSPLNTCLKDRYTLIEQSGSRYSNRAVTVFFRGAV